MFSYFDTFLIRVSKFIDKTSPLPTRRARVQEKSHLRHRPITRSFSSCNYYLDHNSHIIRDHPPLLPYPSFGHYRVTSPAQTATQGYEDCHALLLLVLPTLPSLLTDGINAAYRNLYMPPKNGI